MNPATSTPKGHSLEPSLWPVSAATKSCVPATALLFFVLLVGVPLQASPAGTSPALDADRRAEIVATVAEAIHTGYVFEDKAQEIHDHLKARLAGGSYDSITDLGAFADQLTVDMRSVNQDRHLSARILPPPDDNEKQGISPAERSRQGLERARLGNYGFERLERLPGNVGYLDLRGFADASVARETAVAAMNFLANTDAVIFDLRWNGGGSPSMIQLLSSYLFEDRVHLNSFYMRGVEKNREFWTQEEVDGDKMTKQPVFVLTSSFTFSAAEEFSYNLRNLKRATLVGETTGGGAHPVTSRVFPELGLQLSIPFGRAINPITKTNWEGVGVEPHLSVNASEALTVAHTRAIEQLLTDQALSAQHERLLHWTLDGLKRGQPLSISSASDQYKGFDTSFGDQRIFEKDGELLYRRSTRPARRLLLLGDDELCFEDLESRRLTLERLPSGEATVLLMEYPDGRRQSFSASQSISASQ